MGRVLIPETTPLNKNNDSDILLVSEPFQKFRRDCEHCRCYVESPNHFVTGGYCDKHGLDCGWGFTCNDWKNESE